MYEARQNKETKINHIINHSINKRCIKQFYISNSLKHIMQVNRKNYPIRFFTNENSITTPIQMLKWIRDKNQYMIINDDLTVRKPTDREEMENFPGSDSWRPNAVWDDDNKYWYMKDGNNLRRKNDIEDLEIELGSVSKYDEGEDKNFGHNFAFTVYMNGKKIEWKEKTNKIYDAIERINQWEDLYPKYKDSSNVFINARTISDKDKSYHFKDCPGILKTSNNERELNFDLCFTDKKNDKKSISATQILKTDSDKQIEKQNFDWEIV